MKKKKSFSVGKHLNVRRQLLTDENFALFEEIVNCIYSGRSKEALAIRAKREQLILDVCRRFEIPEELLTSKDEITHLQVQVRGIARRIKDCEDKGISEGSLVYHADDTRKTPCTVLKVRSDFSLQLEGRAGYIQPKDVEHVPTV